MAYVENNRLVFTDTKGLTTSVSLDAIWKGLDHPKINLVSKGTWWTLEEEESKEIDRILFREG